MPTSATDVAPSALRTDRSPWGPDCGTAPGPSVRRGVLGRDLRGHRRGARADLQGDDAHQLRPGRDGDARRVHRLRPGGQRRPAGRRGRGHLAMLHHGGPGRRAGTHADPAVRPVQPPGAGHHHAGAVPAPQLHRRDDLGLRPAALPRARSRAAPSSSSASRGCAGTPSARASRRSCCWCCSPCCSTARRSAWPSGRCRRTSSRPSCPASRSGGRCSSAGRSPPRSAPSPACCSSRPVPADRAQLRRAGAHLLLRCGDPRRPRQPVGRP